MGLTYYYFTWYFRLKANSHILPLLHLQDSQEKKKLYRRCGTSNLCSQNISPCILSPFIVNISDLLCPLSRAQRLGLNLHELCHLVHHRIWRHNSKLLHPHPSFYLLLCFCQHPLKFAGRALFRCNRQYFKLVNFNPIQWSVSNIACNQMLES